MHCRTGKSDGGDGKDQQNKIASHTSSSD